MELPGTKSAKEELKTNHDFTDQYAKQWMQTISWLKKELRKKAARREEQRRTDSGWLEEHRGILRNLAGTNLFESEASDFYFDRIDDRRAAYILTLNNGLIFTGLILLPENGEVSGIVIFSDPDRKWFGPQFEAVSYLDHGFAVLQPFLANEAHSFKNDEERKWYAHPDHELLQHFSFICGGSLAGMEGVELYTVVNEILNYFQKKDLPIIVDLRGRQLLSGIVSCALHPHWASMILIDQTARQLDHQEEDVISNTLWAFHQNMDLLTLLQLAEGTDVVFTNQRSISKEAANVALWFSGNPDLNRRVILAPSSGHVEELHALLKPLSEVAASIPPFPDDGRQPEFTQIELYHHAMLAKTAFLEAMHAKAKVEKQTRYDADSQTIEAYKKNVEQAINEVMGDLLPRREDLHVRTNLLSTPETASFHIYECILETVPGIDTAGYLLMPKENGVYPAVICQHGLLGRPDDLTGIREDGRNGGMARTLAEKGYVVYVPFMNWGWGGEPARNVLAKHAYALGITPNQFELAQLKTIVDFLQSRREILSQRIGFYGLSYGGHASLWLCAGEPRLSAVITAGHFNDWHNKLVSTECFPPFTSPESYISKENCIDMFSFGVLHKLGHAELATFQAPRPHRVENVLGDPETPAPWVESEFKKVQKVYDKMNSSDLVELMHANRSQWFLGQETLQFLEKHMKR